MPDTIPRQRVTRRHHERRDGRDLHLAWQRPDALALKIGGRERGPDPGSREGRLRVDRADSGMCYGRAQDVAEELAPLCHVVDEATTPGQEALVLETTPRTSALRPSLVVVSHPV
jgi:hypothetical protein